MFYILTDIDRLRHRGRVRFLTKVAELPEISC